MRYELVAGQYVENEVVNILTKSLILYYRKWLMIQSPLFN